MAYGDSMKSSGNGGMKVPMHTSGGKAPGVKRISKHPMKTMTSRKSQQMKGGC